MCECVSVCVRAYVAGESTYAVCAHVCEGGKCVHACVHVSERVGVCACGCVCGGECVRESIELKERRKEN